MTASEGSFLGVAIQSAAGAEETRDDQFKYLLFREGSVAPNNISIPLGPEVGGGALERSIVKVGVNTGGALDIIPRPETLGMFLYGITGQVSSSQVYDDDAVLLSHALDGSTVSTNLGQPSTATAISVVGSSGANGNITIAGNVGGAPDTEDIALSGTTRVTGVKLFQTITGVTLPNDVGETASVGWMSAGAYRHVFTLPTDQFAAPYWTVRSAPGNMWGERFVDARFNMLSLAWQSPGFVTGGVGMIGGMPYHEDDMSNWDAEDYVDGGPQFITPVGDIELPLSTNLSVLSGGFAAQASIPLDQQYVVGSYAPQGLDIVQRAFALTLAVKITDDYLYKRMQYDPAGGSDWVASLYKEGNFKVYFASDQDASSIRRTDQTAGAPYSFQIAGNGQSGANSNVIWTAQPIAPRAQRQIVMAVNGMFVASPSGAPITLTLVNQRASYAYVTP